MPIISKPKGRVSLARAKKISLVVRVIPTESSQKRYSPDRAFVACASFKHGGGATYPKLRDACGYGRNPRQAIARALGAAKRKIEARRGAFRGVM